MDIPRSAISLRQLRYLVAVADAGSISTAADQLHVAQPALSRQIASLESAVGLRLLDRSRRGVTLTTGGTRLYRLARDVLERLGSAQSELRASQKRPAGVVTIALPPSVASMLVPKIVLAIESHYPEIVLRIEDGLSLENGRSLESALIDFGVVPSANDLVDVEHEPLVRESLLLVERRNASSRAPATVTLQQAAKRRLILPPRSFHTRRVIDEAVRASGLTLDIRHEQRSVTTIVSLVRDGLGSTITNSPAVEQFWAPGTVAARRIVRPAIGRTISLARSNKRQLSLAAEVVYGIVRRLAMAAVEEGRWQGTPLG
jgi:LysR family transcriptional regulator, nitrogen assimilation regulatory protein